MLQAVFFRKHQVQYKYLEIIPMNKTQLNFGGAICLIAVSYFIYYLLVLDKDLPFSIGSILASVHHWGSEWRILIVGLLPIYVAFVLFGMAVLGMYLGSTFQQWVTRIMQPKLCVSRFCKKNTIDQFSKNPVSLRSSTFKKI